MLVAAQLSIDSTNPVVLEQAIQILHPRCLVVPQDRQTAICFIQSLVDCPQIEVMRLGWTDREATTTTKYIQPIPHTSFHLVEMVPSGITAHEIFEWFTAYYPSLKMTQFQTLPDGICFLSPDGGSLIYLQEWQKIDGVQYFTEIMVDSRSTSQTLYKFEPHLARQTFLEMLRTVTRLAVFHSKELSGDVTISLPHPQSLHHVQIGLCL